MVRIPENSATAQRSQTWRNLARRKQRGAARLSDHSSSTSLMNTSRPQQTIRREAFVEGFGYWGGKDVRVEFRPAPAGTGIVFVRSDLDLPLRIPALVQNCIEIPRRTILGIGGA